MKPDEEPPTTPDDAVGSFDMMCQAAIKADAGALDSQQPPQMGSIAMAELPAQYDSSQNITLSSYQQWRLLNSKNSKLLFRDVYNTLCITLVPAILVFGISALTLLGSVEDYPGGLNVVNTMRDASIVTSLSDRFDDQTGDFQDNERSDNKMDSDEVPWVGDVLFAQTVASPSTLATDLCEYVMNTNNLYTDALSLKYGPDKLPVDSVMATTCGVAAGALTNGTCSCALSGPNQQVFSSVDALDSFMLELASTHYRPITAAIVVTDYDATIKAVSWNFRFNRTTIKQSGTPVSDFVFYNPAQWVVYSGAGYLVLQRFVDSFFIRQFSTLSQPLDVLQPYFQLFPKDKWSYDAAKFGFLGGTFQWIFGFCMIFTLSSMVQAVVYEKQKRIKEGMLMMGLKTSVWWLSWITTYFFVFGFVSLSCTLACFSFVFKESSFLVVWLFMFFFLLSIEALGLFLAALFSSPGTASIAAIFIYLIGIFVPSALFGLPRPMRLFLSVLLSPFAFYWGFTMFATYEGAVQGVKWDNFFEVYEQGALDPIYLWEYILVCIGDTLMYLLLAFYADQVNPGELGAKHPPWFPFLPSYWCGSSAQHNQETAKVSSSEKLPSSEMEPVDEVQFGQPSLRAIGLRKVFHSNGIEKIAVHDFSLDIYEQQVTALLGHNGAGKTTTFNMLTGLMPPTAGDALIYGLSIKQDLSNVRKTLGVCPQHDVLWDQLTVMEHLQLFAALKGVPSEMIDHCCHDTIAAVGLTEKCEQYSCTLSGGMKRKLSIGIATIGNSKVCGVPPCTSQCC